MRIPFLYKKLSEVIKQSIAENSNDLHQVETEVAHSFRLKKGDMKEILKELEDKNLISVERKKHKIAIIS